MRSVKLGNGLESATEMGPMINSSQRDNVEALVKESIAHGGEVVAGGGRGNFRAGYFFEPTLVRIATADNPLFRREIFGPVMPVTTFRTTEEAIRLANDTEYGLASYIWTNDLNTSIHVSEQIEFGIVGINEWYPWALEAPFGGWKQSGLGYECGREGLAEYQEKKLISIGGL
jgi:acyl-CoA reductase-like NAD-dependent aldehyde dehydrogenase